MKSICKNTLPVLIMFTLSACSGSGGDAGINFPTNPDADSMGNSLDSNLDIEDQIDDQFTVKEFNGTMPDERGRYLIANVTSYTNPTNGYQEFLGGVVAHTARPDLYSLNNGECLVGSGGLVASSFLTANSSRESLTAGVVVLTSNGNTILTLENTTSYFFYTDNTVLTDPHNITASFTGGEAPAFEVQIPNIEPLQMLSDLASETFTVESVYRWVPGTNSEAYVIVSGSDIDNSRQPNPIIAFSCRVEDNGEFSIPGRIVDQLGEDLEFGLVSVARHLSEFTIQNNMIVDTSVISVQNSFQ